MTENLKKFLEYISNNEDAAQKIKALTNESDKDTVIRQAIEIAKDTGFSLSAEDFEENAAGELSEDELSSVAGGKTCVCAVGGGGESDNSDCLYKTNETCWCVVGGSGSYHLYGEDYTRCACAFAGYGSDY